MMPSFAGTCRKRARSAWPRRPAKVRSRVRVQVLGFRVRVWGLCFRVEGLWFRVRV